MLKRILSTAALSTFVLMGSAQLNDLAAGIDMYGMTMKDRMKERSWVHFTSGRPGQLDRIAGLFEDDEYMIKIPRCGAMTPDGFYGYMARAYSLGEYAYCFYKLNIETGQYDIVLDMTDDNRWGPNWPVLYDLEYNHANGKTYAIGRYTYNDMPSSGLYTVDTKTGLYTNVLTNLGFYAIAMAVDYDGNFYFVKWDSADGENITGTILVKMTMDDDGNLDQEWEKRIYVDGQEFAINYTNDLAFDYTTGDLYWVADDSMNWQRLVRIDPETGQTTRLGGIGSYESINTLYIPFTTAESRTAPARVDHFAVSYADRGQSMTLSWTNPSTCWNRTPLTNLSSINIARDSESNIIASIDAQGKEGQMQSYTDATATQGVHTYYVTAVNADGKGIVNSYLVQTGEDTPGKVQSLAISKVSDEEVRLAWSKPTIGAHDGWFDDSNLTYNIVRYPDEKVVASGLNATTFTDTDLNDYTSYSYKVQAVSAAGEGLVAQSESVYAGTAIHAPFYAKFTSWKEVELWSVIDANGDNKTWQYDGEDTQEIFQRMALNSESVDNDYLVSPKLFIEAGKTYRVRASINMDRPNQYIFEFHVGDAPTVEALQMFASFDHEIIDKQGGEYVTIPYEGTFKATYTGTAFVAIRSCSLAGLGTNVAVYDVAFEEVPEYDLAVAEVKTIPDGIVGKPSSATVKVVNRGLKSLKVDDYCIEAINIDNGNVLGTGKGNYTITAEDEDEVEMNFTPDTDGRITIAFRVVCEKDGNAANNQSAPLTMSVAESDTQDWNVEILDGDVRGERIDRETRVPFDFTAAYSIVQSIYPYDLIGKAGKIVRIGYRYTPNVSSLTGNIMASISLGKTSLKKYRSKADALPESQLINVFNGVIHLDCTEGEHVLAFDFDAFELKEGENLVVSVGQESRIDSTWPIITQNFNYGTQTWGSVRASSESSMPIITTGQTLEMIPQLLLAIDTEVGVETVEVGHSEAPTYDLFGRRVNAAQQGIFVVNGKKIIK